MASVNRYHYSHYQLRQRLQLLIDAYSYAPRLKTLKGARAHLDRRAKSIQKNSYHHSGELNRK